MPKFDIQTYERWDFVVHYTIDADSAEVAVRRIVTGGAGYVSSQHQEIGPALEVVRIMEVMNCDTREQIADEAKLNRLLGGTFN